MSVKSLFHQEEIPTRGDSNELFQAIPESERFSLTEKGLKILLARINEPFKETSDDLLALKKKHPEIVFDTKRTKSLKFQLVTLTALHPEIAFTRKDLEAFVAKIGLESGDVIQAVNKTPQWGLARWTKTVNGKTFYGVSYPLRYDNSKLRLRKNPRDLEQREEMIEDFKNHITKTFLEAKDWDLGHMDPANGDEAGLVLQPASYNRAHRDNYKFDQHGLKKCPNADYLLRKPDKFYNKEEIEKLVRGLAEYLDGEKA